MLLVNTIELQRQVGTVGVAYKHYSVCQSYSRPRAAVGRSLCGILGPERPGDS